MSKGRIEQLGTPLEIYNRPATRFVAGFFGMPTMNFLEGVVEAGAGSSLFRGRGIEQPLPASRSGNLNGGAVSLGVRSEHVLIDGAAQTPGTARLLEPLGDATLVHFDAAEGMSLVAKVPPDTALTPGAPLKFRFAPDHCHLFEAAESCDQAWALAFTNASCRASPSSAASGMALRAGARGPADIYEFVLGRAFSSLN
jgi:multiple sugar transport system ATP-binding protein